MHRFLWFVWGFALAVILAVGLILGPLQDLRAGQPSTPLAPTQAPVAAPTASPAPTSAPSGLHWQREGRLTGALHSLTIRDLNEVHYAPGSGGPRLAYLTQAERVAYTTFVARYRSFTYAAQASDGTASDTVRLRFTGQGAQAPTEAEQLEVARWVEGVLARLVTEEQRADLLAQARLHLAGRTQMAPDDLVTLALEATTWPDACLGIQEAGLFCAEVLTPGYRIQLQAGDAVYEYHADLHGQLRAVPQPAS